MTAKKDLEELVGFENYAFPAEAKTIVINFGNDYFHIRGRGRRDWRKVADAVDLLYTLSLLGKNVVALDSGNISDKSASLQNPGYAALLQDFIARWQPVMKTPQDPKYEQIIAQINQRLNTAQTTEPQDSQRLIDYLQASFRKGPFILNTQDQATVGKLLQEYEKTWPEIRNSSMHSLDDYGLAFLAARHIKADALILANEKYLHYKRPHYQSKMTIFEMAAPSGIYVAAGSPSQISKIALGEDIGSKYLPDAWGNRATPNMIGDSAHVRKAFIEEYRISHRGSVHGDYLTVQMPMGPELWEASYSINKELNKPSFLLRLRGIRQKSY